MLFRRFACWGVVLLIGFVSAISNGKPIADIAVRDTTAKQTMASSRLTPNAAATNCYNINWASWPSTTTDAPALTGTINNGGDVFDITMTANYAFGTTADIWNYNPRLINYPANIPNSTVPRTEWAKGVGGQTTMCFSKKVTNPVLLLASLGSSTGVKVNLRFSIPYVVVYDGGDMTFTDSYNLSGIEGYAIIMFPGDFDCVTVYSDTQEYFTNLTWGIKPQPFPVNITEDIKDCTQVKLTAGGGVSYEWSGGDTPNSASNTFHKSGTYIVTATDANGCKASASREVNVGPPVTATKVSESCGTATYTATGGTSYSWSGGDTPNSATNTFHQDGFYKLTVTDGSGCSNTDNIAVTVPAGPTVSVTGNTSGCGSVTLTANGGDTYQWNGGDTPTSASNTFHQSGTYSVIIKDNTSGCAVPVTKAVTVSVSYSPAVSVTASPAGPVCPGTPVTFSANAQNAGPNYVLTWYRNNIEAATGPTYTTDKLVNNDNIVCKLTSSNSCVTPTSSNLVTPAIYAAPVINLQSRVLKSGNGVHLNPVVTGNVQSYLWSPATGLSDPTLKDPVADPQTSTTYTLTATSPTGCKTDASVNVVVQYDLAIPNTFTPNGDGINDKWNINYLNLLTDATVDIYTRWGKQVFHSVGYAIPWDGTYKGRPVAAGNYYYIIYSAATRQRYSGYITVLR